MTKRKPRADLQTKGPRPPDFTMADHWAVDTVVTEGVRMNLSETEMIMVAGRLQDKGRAYETIADILHVSVRKVEALLRCWERAQARAA